MCYLPSISNTLHPKGSASILLGSQIHNDHRQTIIRSHGVTQAPEKAKKGAEALWVKQMKAVGTHTVEGCLALGTGFRRSF